MYYFFMFQSYHIYVNDILVLAISSTLICWYVYTRTNLVPLSFELRRLNIAYKETELYWHVPT